MPRPPGCIVSAQARLEPNRNMATHVDQRLPERGVAPSAESPLQKRNNLHHGNTMATLSKHPSPRVLLLSDVAPQGERAQDVQSGVISGRSVRRFMFPCTHGAPSNLDRFASLAPSKRRVDSPPRGYHLHDQLGRQPPPGPHLAKAMTGSWHAISEDAACRTRKS